MTIAEGLTRLFHQISCLMCLDNELVNKRFEYLFRRKWKNTANNQKIAETFWSITNYRKNIEMFLLTIIEVLIVFFVTAYLLYKYAAREVPYYVFFLVYITWLLCFCVVALLPLDVFYVFPSSSLSWHDNFPNSLDITVEKWRGSQQPGYHTGMAYNAKFMGRNILGDIRDDLVIHIVDLGQFHDLELGSSFQSSKNMKMQENSRHEEEWSVLWR